MIFILFKNYKNNKNQYTISTKIINIFSLKNIFFKFIELIYKILKTQFNKQKLKNEANKIWINPETHCDVWRANAKGIGFHWRWQPATTVPRPLFGGQCQSHNYTFVLHFWQCLAESEADADAAAEAEANSRSCPLSIYPSWSASGREWHLLRYTYTYRYRYICSHIDTSFLFAFVTIVKRFCVHCPDGKIFIVLPLEIGFVGGFLQPTPTPGSGLFLLRFLSKAIRILLTEGVQSGLGRKTGPYSSPFSRRILWLI